MIEMNEEEQYLADQISTWVWSGFYDRKEVNASLDDVLEGDVDESMLRALIEEEFQRKAVEEKSWLQFTDCNRLDAVFGDLNRAMIIALQNAGYTTSDGHDDVSEIHAKQPHGTYKGYCFYHGQDLERAVAGEGLWLAFGDLIMYLPRNGR